jgi:hypothetical protein
MIARHIDMSQVEDAEGKTWPVRVPKTQKRWQKLIRYFIDTPIQLSTGERFVKHGGVPSGSCFTNLVDGIVNALVTRYIIYSMTNQLPKDDIYLGDDIVAVTEKPLDLQLFAEIAQKTFTMRFNPDKSYQTSNKTNIHFLGYYNMHGVPYKPMDTIIASSIYPERPVLSKFETCVRLIGQAYSCFEPQDAKKMFLAANILQDEEQGLTELMIEEFISTHGHWFKYLATIGISSKSLKVPRVKSYDDVWLTLPMAPRRGWKPTYRNLNDLAELAYHKWTNHILDQKMSHIIPLLCNTHTIHCDVNYFQMLCFLLGQISIL